METCTFHTLLIFHCRINHHLFKKEEDPSQQAIYEVIAVTSSGTNQGKETPTGCEDVPLKANLCYEGVRESMAAYPSCISEYKGNP